MVTMTRSRAHSQGQSGAGELSGSWTWALPSTCCGCHRSALQREEGPGVFRKEILQPLLCSLALQNAAKWPEAWAGCTFTPVAPSMCDCPVPAAVLPCLPHHFMSTAVRCLSPAWSSNPLLCSMTGAHRPHCPCTANCC